MCDATSANVKIIELGMGGGVDHTEGKNLHISSRSEVRLLIATWAEVDKRHHFLPHWTREKEWNNVSVIRLSMFLVISFEASGLECKDFKSENNGMLLT